MPIIGPARLIVGAYAGARSPVWSPHGVNYLLTTLKPGERWTYEPPLGHLISWVAVGKGALTAGRHHEHDHLSPFFKKYGPQPFQCQESARPTPPHPGGHPH